MRTDLCIRAWYGGIFMAEQTPLYREHLQLSGKMVEFAGFILPVQYPDGISAEHLAVRQIAGLFDVSHMGEIEVSGEQTYAFLDYLLSRSLAKIDENGQIRHRMGDLGWLDNNGRIWFCGRKNHRAKPGIYPATYPSIIDAS